MKFDSRPVLHERRRPPERKAAEYRSSYRNRNRYSTPWWQSRSAMVGYLMAAVLTVVGIGSEINSAVQYNKLHGTNAVSREMIEDPSILPQQELSDNYNLHISNTPDVRLDLRQAIKEDDFMKRLKEAKDSGQKSEFYIVLVDGPYVDAKFLSPKQKKIPGLVDCLKAKAQSQDMRGLGGNYTAKTVNGVTREYVTVAVRGGGIGNNQARDFGELSSSQSFVEPDDLSWRTGKPRFDEYPIVGNTVAINLYHELGHANGLNHPDTDIIGVFNRITEEFRYKNDFGSDKLYPFHLRTSEGVDIITKSTGNGRI